MVRKLDHQPIDIGNQLDVDVNFRLVDSSNVDRIGWDKFGNMYVLYKSGYLYLYFNVSRQRAVAAAYASSVGRYIHKKIKGKYECHKLVAV